MRKELKRIRGFVDWYDKRGNDFNQVRNYLINHYQKRNYTYVEFPLVEDRNLFSRSIGTDTEIVNKEMFDIKARGEGRTWVLRPEATAQGVRLFLENKLYTRIDQYSIKLMYFGPMFRYERPQHNRFRQFYSFGVEYYYQPQFLKREIAIIDFLNDLHNLLKMKNIELLYNWLPTNERFDLYKKELVKYFSKKEIYQSLCDKCKTRLKKNVLRIIDCKTEDKKKWKNIPLTINYLSKEEKEIYQIIKNSLKNFSINVKEEKFLVRGIDYYTGFVFEVINLNDKDRSTSSCMGGGEYNHLVQIMSFNKVTNWNAIGFGAGFERLINLFVNNRKITNKLLLSIDSDKEINNLLELKNYLLDSGYIVEFRTRTRKLKKEIEWAIKNDFTYFIDCKDNNNNIILKNLITREEKELKWRK